MKGKRTRDQPNLCDCHGCKFHLSNVGEDRLQPLPSEWRIVLLCKKCFSRIQSSQMCPYCFQETAAASDCFRCSRCRRRLHRDCVLQCRDVAPWSYSCSGNPEFSVCIDCWVPRSMSNSARVCSSREKMGRKSCLVGITDSRALNGSGDGGVGRAELEDVVKDANSVADKKLAKAGRAKEEALRKVDVARKAVELASNALELVVKREEGSGRSDGVDAAIDDAALAFRLHQAMNCSRRISRNICILNSSSTSIRAPLKSKNSGVVSRKFEVCHTNTNMSYGEADVYASDGVADEGTGTAKDQCHRGSGDREELLPKVRKNSLTKLTASSGCDDSMQSEAYPQIHDLSTSKFGRCNMPDRYVKKYSRRRLLDDTVDRKQLHPPNQVLI